MKNTITLLGKSIASLSFMIGTLILIQFAITLNSKMVEGGFYFIEYAFYANCLVFIIVVFVMFWEKGNVWQFSKTLLWMLANIPVVIIYIIIAIKLDAISQVTCKNEYDESMFDVELNWGNGKETWREIEPDESFFERFVTNKSPVVLKYTYQNHVQHDTLYYPYPSFSEVSSYSIGKKTKRLKY